MTEKRQEPITGFLKIEYGLLQATQLTNHQTGEVLKWDTETAILYSYLYDKYLFFKSQQKNFYETYHTISKTIGCSESTAKRRMKSLTDIGVVSVTHIKLPQHIGFQKCNSYEVEDVLGSLRFSFDIPIKRTDVPVQQKYNKPPHRDDGEDYPF